MLIAGIDCGVKGAIAWLSSDGHLIEVLDLPVAEIKVGKAIRRRLVPALLGELLTAQGRTPAHVFVESVSSRPGEGAVGAFAFGRGFGQIEGLLAGLGIPFTLVTPGVWKKRMGVPADKGSCRARACQLWPGAAGRFARCRDDGRAEAAQIGLYGCQGHTTDPAKVKRVRTA
jgi:crossover junction endodeoxyribonuclease RuvC